MNMCDEVTTPERIRVLIADDHPVCVSGLRALLSSTPGIEIVGEAYSGPDLLSQSYRLQPHVVLTDIRMPGLDGIEATKSIAVRCTGTAVIIMTMVEDSSTFFAAMRAGAKGYLLKGASAEELMTAIGTVRRGGVVFGPQVAGWVVSHLTQPAVAGKPFPELTERERLVLELVADGRGNANIANQLGLSIKTVRNYLSRIFAKLQTADRTEAAVLARRAGLGH